MVCRDFVSRESRNAVKVPRVERHTGVVERSQEGEQNTGVNNALAQVRWDDKCKVLPVGVIES